MTVEANCSITFFDEAGKIVAVETYADPFIFRDPQGRLCHDDGKRLRFGITTWGGITVEDFERDFQAKMKRATA